MQAAAELTGELADRFRVGDAAPELVARLAAAVATIEREAGRAGPLPDDLRTDVAELMAVVQAAAAAGGRWLDAAADGPELANLHMRARVQRLYGAPARDGTTHPP